MIGIQVADPASLGATQRKARRTVKLTEENLVLQTGIFRPRLRAIEQGKETAHVDLVLQFCRGLNAPLLLTLPDEGTHR